jgi:hypothetical protein
MDCNQVIDSIYERQAITSDAARKFIGIERLHLFEDFSIQLCRLLYFTSSLLRPEVQRDQYPLLPDRKILNK